MIAGKLLFSSLQTEAVATDWRQIEIATSSAPEPKSRVQSHRFLGKLEMQTQILLNSSTSLREELNSFAPHFTLLSSKLAVQCTQSKSVDIKLTESLCRTLITPIDCEDLKRLSHVIHKLTATQLRLAQSFATVTSAATVYSPLQDCVVHCADSLDRAVQSLKKAELDKHCHSLHVHWRRARTTLRQIHASQWDGQRELRTIMAEQLLYVEFAAELGYIKAAYDTLMRTRLKNG